MLLVCAMLMVLAGSASAHTIHNALDLVRVENIVEQRNGDVAIAVSPTAVKYNGEWVTVSWSGVAQPKKDDWIGIYAGDVKVTDVTPVKYVYPAEVVADYLQTGSGSHRFRLINMRTHVWFGLFSGGLSAGKLMASSPSNVTFGDPNEALQGHVTVTDQQGEMLVTWVTRDVGKPTVQFGTSASTLDHTVAASTTQYTRDMFCGPPATTTGWNVLPGVIHTAKLTGLAPATKYYFTFGDSISSTPRSAVASFTTAPKLGPDAVFNTVIFGDLGQAEIDGSTEASQMVASLNTTRTINALLEEHKTQFIVHCGDISYARGFSSLWDTFFDQLTDSQHHDTTANPRTAYAGTPFVTNIGNHERDYPNSHGYFNGTDSGGECGVAYEYRLPMPRPSRDQPWYSVNYGSIHLLMFSTEHDFLPGSAQYSFIEKDLRAVDRSVTPWLIVSGHRPMYISSTNFDKPAGDQPVAVQLQDTYSDLFLETKVDLGIFGHHHSAQRTCPVHKNQCVTPSAPGEYAAPVYLVVGHAGAGSSTNIQKPQPAIFEFVDDHTHGYANMDVSPDKLTIDFIAAADGSTFHHFELMRSKL